MFSCRLMMTWCLFAFVCLPQVKASTPSVQAIRTFSGHTMGTKFFIKVVEPGREVHWQRVERQIRAILDRIDRRMSTYRQESELSLFNQSKENEWFSVSQETLTVIDQALKIGRLSDGTFDITVGPLINRWGFGPGPEPANWPNASEVAHLRTLVGFEKLKIRTNPPALQKTLKSLYVDLSSIAKGYAVDQVCEMLLRERIPRYLVEIGGEIRAQGTRQDGELWQVAIEQPSSKINSRSIQRIVAIQDLAVATSGTYRNVSEKNGAKMHHIIDPRTGQPTAHQGAASVTVIDRSSMVTDAWATAMQVLGPIEGIVVANREKLAVMFLVQQGQKWREIHSHEFFERYVKTHSHKS